jgi:hypothetical protein
VDAASALEDAIVSARNVYTSALTHIRDVALLTYATPRVPNLQPFESVLPQIEQCHVIGDAYAPGTIMAATAHGHRIGNLI